MVERLFGGEIPKIEHRWKDIINEKNEKYNKMNYDEKRYFYHTQLALVKKEKLRKQCYPENTCPFSKEERKMLVWLDLEDYQCSKEEYIQTAKAQAYTTFAVIKDGKWYDRREMGWRECVSNELDEYGSGSITTTNTIINSEGVVEFEHKILISTCMMQSLYKEADAPSMGFVTVSSDGLGTYQDDPKNVEEKKSYKDSDIIPLVMAYKNITGEFVTRRMQRLKYDLEKKLIVHLDDVSCSSIAIS